MNQGFPWHALATTLLVGVLWAAALLYLFSLRRYDTYRTAARLLLLVSGMLALVVLGTGLAQSGTDFTLLYQQHRALGIATVVVLLLTALFALVEPLALWLPVFTGVLLVVSLVATSAAWVWGQRVRALPGLSAPETLQVPQEEVEPDTGEVWMEDTNPELPEP